MLRKLGPIDRRKKRKKPKEPLPRKDYSGSRKEAYGVSAFYVLLAIYKNGAADRELRFDLSDEEFWQLTSGDCYYCGTEPKQLSRKGSVSGAYTYNGIDRKDNSIGYTMSNCVSCCKVCNFSKRTSSDIEFTQHCCKIADFTRKKCIDKLEILCEYTHH